MNDMLDKASKPIGLGFASRIVDGSPSKSPELMMRKAAALRSA